MFPTKCQIIWPSGFRGEDFLQINQSETRIACSGHVCYWIGTELSNLYRGPSIYASLPCFGSFGPVVSEEKIFRNRPSRNKNCLWWPCLLLNWNEMTHFYREPSIDPSYQVFVHLAMQLQRRRSFRNQPIRNKNCLWRSCLLTDLDEMSFFFYKGPDIDDSYQVSVHLAKGSQRRRLKCEKLKDDRWWTPSDGKSSHCLWQMS
jgi:hypothetical protein